MVGKRGALLHSSSPRTRNYEGRLGEVHMYLQQNEYNHENVKWIHEKEKINSLL